jgi:hypothetical protein
VASGIIFAGFFLLLGEGNRSGKEWFDNRLKELADIFALSVGGFSVMDNGQTSREAAKP